MQLVYSTLCIAGLVIAVIGDSSTSCSNPLYQSLAGFQPAEEFCEKHFPRPAVTVTGSPKFCRSLEQRDISWSPSGADSRDILWSSLKNRAGSILSAVCACVNTPRTSVVYPTRTTQGGVPTTTTKDTRTTSSYTGGSSPGSTTTTPSSLATTQSSLTTRPTISPSLSTIRSSTFSTFSSLSATSLSTTPLLSRSVSPSTSRSTTPSTNLPTSSATTSSSTPPTTPSTTNILTTTTSSDPNCPSFAPIYRDCQPGRCAREQLGTCTKQPSQAACEEQCNNEPRGCYAINYSNTGYCTLYGTCHCLSTCGSDRPIPVRRDCQPGFCDRREISCSLTNSQIDCETTCNNTPGCFAINYNPNNDYCVTYGNCDCPATCDATRPAPIQRNCDPGSCSRPEISCSLAKSLTDCQTTCDNTPGCYAINYNSNNDQCVTYGNCNCPTTCDATRPAPIQRSCNPGSCPRPEISCSLTTSQTDCQTTCNNTPGCYAVNYNSNNDQCVTYGNCNCPTTCNSNRPAPARKSCGSGSCARPEISCSLASSNAACQGVCDATTGCFAVNYDAGTGQCVTYGDCVCVLDIVGV